MATDGWQAALASPILELLNVRFVLAHPHFDLRPGGWQLRWEDANLRIWEMSPSRQLPRAYTVPRADHTLIRHIPANAIHTRECLVAQRARARS